jgi:predicted P-loop ATPase
MSNKLLEAALKYATEYGWAVFPCSSTSKKPLTPHGCKDAKKSVGAIKAWWNKWPDASVGVATGTASNLIVIDEDLDEDKGLNGYEEVSAWERINGKLPDTALCITGRGGYHLYYRYDKDDIKNRAGLLDGVDVRGEGGYVIAPPSMHPNGTEYQWEDSPDEIALASVDGMVRKFLFGDNEKPRSAAEFKLPDRIQSGERNETLFKLACSMQSQGLPDAAIVAALEQTNQTACDEPLDTEELETIISSALRYNKGELRTISQGMPEWREPNLTMMLDKDGNVTDRPAQTIHNAEEAIMYDRALFGRIRYNEIAYSPYVYGNLPWKEYRGWREWTNADDSNLRAYIEKSYGIKSSEKIMDALTNVCSKQTVNPIKAMLETCHDNWDGNKHIENLLPMMLGAEKSEYTTEVMRLVMLGAVARIYKPGCKFDYMMVLVSDQGIGKSTFLRLLCLNDAWFNDNFSTLDGDKAVEKLRGMWIVELAELQATKKSKDVETIKAFITSRVDTYRAPYGRRTEQRPRMCILCGTSNPTDFLTDRTGNRRFLPITCGTHHATFDMFADEVATKAEFSQAWGEIMDEYMRKGGKVSLVLPKRLQAVANDMQSRYQEEDPRVGIIQEWLDKTENGRVCAAMLWKEALGNDYGEPRRVDVREIHDIMRNAVADWKPVGKRRCGDYGVQRCYERVAKFTEIPENKAERLPFA